MPISAFAMGAEVYKGHIILVGGTVNDSPQQSIYAYSIANDTYKLLSTPEEVFTLYRKSDVDELMSEFKVTRLHYLGTDMLTRFIADAIDTMDDATFDFAVINFALAKLTQCGMITACKIIIADILLSVKPETDYVYICIIKHFKQM